MRFFTSELKRFFGVSWIAAALILLIPMVLENMRTFSMMYTEQIDFTAPMVNVFLKSALLPFSLFAVCMVGSASYLSDKKNGMLRFLVSRSGRLKFALTRFFANSLMSAFAVVFAQLLFLWFCLIVFPYPDMGYYGADKATALEGFFYDRPSLAYHLSILIQFLPYAAWAGLALAASVWIRNQYITLFVPFLAYNFTMVLFSSFADLHLAASFFNDMVWFPYELSMVQASDFSAYVTGYCLLFGGILAVSLVAFIGGVIRYDGAA